MPNWCANRLYISGNEEQIRRVRDLMTGNVYPRVDVAIWQSIKLFLAGCAGFLQPTTDTAYEAYPALCYAGTGDDSPENRAFMQWLELLKQNVELNVGACARIAQLYQSSGLDMVTWDELTDSMKAVITPILQAKYHDWSGDYFGTQRDYAGFWMAAGGTDERQAASPFDMRLLLPTRLAVELNGFNGRFLEGVLSGYDFYTWHRYAIKWPVGTQLMLSTDESNFLAVDFDTPWCTPHDNVFTELSGQYQCNVKHYFSEAGVNFCGYRAYSAGEQIDSEDDSLEYDEEDEHGWSNVCSPEWILNNVAHFGG